MTTPAIPSLLSQLHNEEQVQVPPPGLNGPGRSNPAANQVAPSDYQLEFPMIGDTASIITTIEEKVTVDDVWIPAGTEVIVRINKLTRALYRGAFAAWAFEVDTPYGLRWIADRPVHEDNRPTWIEVDAP